jgi:hypothetical protein
MDFNPSPARGWKYLAGAADQFDAAYVGIPLAEERYHIDKKTEAAQDKFRPALPPLSHLLL